MWTDKVGVGIMIALVTAYALGVFYVNFIGFRTLTTISYARQKELCPDSSSWMLAKTYLLFSSLVSIVDCFYRSNNFEKVVLVCYVVFAVFQVSEIFSPCLEEQKEFQELYMATQMLFYYNVVKIYITMFFLK